MRRSAKVILSTTLSMASFIFFHTTTELHDLSLSHVSPFSATQYTGAREPSNIRSISPTAISAGGCEEHSHLELLCNW